MNYVSSRDYVQVERPKDVKAALKAILKLYSSPRRWVKGYYSMTKKHRGRQVEECDKRARCWCLSGAITRVCGREDSRMGLRHRVMNVLDKTIQASDFRDSHGNPFHHIVAFNDAKDRRFSEVVSIVRRAVKRAA